MSKTLTEILDGPAVLSVRLYAVLRDPRMTREMLYMFAARVAKSQLNQHKEMFPDPVWSEAIKAVVRADEDRMGVMRHIVRGKVRTMRPDTSHRALTEFRVAKTVRAALDANPVEAACTAAYLALHSIESAVLGEEIDWQLGQLRALTKGM